MKDRNIIIVGMQPWDIEIGSNCKNIAIEFARSNNVLYVNTPLDRYTILSKKHEPKVQKRLSVLKGEKNDLVQVGENIWNLTPNTVLESINWINSKSIFSYLNRINNKRFANCIKSAVAKLNFNNTVLFNDNLILPAYHLKELLSPDVFIYYIRDNLSKVSYFKKHGLRMQEDLIAKASLVTSNSDYLTKYAGQFNPNSFMVGQGCDFSLFDNNKINAAQDIQDLEGIKIGYVGFLTSLRLDIGLLENIALKKPDWKLILVGPEDEDFKNSNLHKMPNVIFTGNKRPETLPSYIKSFDVAINPQVNNEVTIGNYPRKIDEYLALGKPTVATRTDFMSYFKEHTYLASNQEEFISAIEKAFEENNAEKEQQRRAFALEHTWENSVEKIYKSVLKVMSGKDSGFYLKEAI